VKIRKEFIDEIVDPLMNGFPSSVTGNSGIVRYRLEILVSKIFDLKVELSRLELEEFGE